MPVNSEREHGMNSASPKAEHIQMINIRTIFPPVLTVLVPGSSTDHAMAGDRGALMAMSRGVSGWPAGSGWGSKTKLTTWWGVEVENARVTALDLGNRGNDHKLTGEDEHERGRGPLDGSNGPVIDQRIFSCGA